MCYEIILILLNKILLQGGVKTLQNELLHSEKQVEQFRMDEAKLQVHIHILKYPIIIIHNIIICEKQVCQIAFHICLQYKLPAS